MTTTTQPATGRRTMRAPAIAGLAILAALALGGCSNNKTKAEMEGLQRENTELRERNTQVEAALTEAENKNATLASENSQLKQAGPKKGGGSEYGTVGSDVVISIAGDVLFASGSATLKSGAKGELDSVASKLKSQYAGHRIEIAGHTDSDPLKKTKGKWTDNENLSAQRALAVERYLAERGVSRNLMHSAAYGADSPKGNKKESRRVEIRIIGGGAQ